MPAEDTSEKEPPRHKYHWRRRNQIKKSVIGIPAFINAYRNEQKANRKQDAREDSIRRNIEIATLIFVILTTAGIFYQARILNSSDEAIHKSANAAKDAAEAAKASVLTTKAIMQLDQRAWIGVASIRPEPLVPEIGKTFVVAITIKNTGKTPARKIVSRGRGEPIIKTGKPDFSYENVEPFTALLLPSGEATTRVVPMAIPGTKNSVVITQDLIDALAAGQFAVFVHGKFEYEDIFGASHWVRYCANLFVPFNGQFGFCPDHNDTDDYQPPEK